MTFISILIETRIFVKYRHSYPYTDRADMKIVIVEYLFVSTVFLFLFYILPRVQSNDHEYGALLFSFQKRSPRADDS